MRLKVEPQRKVCPTNNTNYEPRGPLFRLNKDTSNPNYDVLCFVENVSNTLGNMLMCKLMNYRKDYLSSYNFFCFSQFIKKLSSAEIFYEKWYSLESCWNYGPSLLWPWLYKWGWGEGGRHRYLLLSLLLWILIRSFATEWQDGGQKEAESGVVW